MAKFESDYKTTEDIKVPETLVDQVIGQERAVEIIKKAAKQRRNILLMGSPGTGKSMLAQAMAELMPAEELEDVLIYPNPLDENIPLVRVVKTYPKERKLPPGAPDIGEGRRIIGETRANRMVGGGGISPSFLILSILVIALLYLSFSGFVEGDNKWVIAAAVLGLFVFGAAIVLASGVSRRMGGFENNEPKLVVDNSGRKNAPFVDATGAKAGALFGDVRHDPLQCIPAGENVILDNGNVVPIERIVDPYFAEVEEGEVPVEKAGVNVLGGVDSKFMFSPAAIRRVYRRKYCGKIISLKTRSGSLIRVTPNHPIAILDADGNPAYQVAAEMKVGDRVVIPEKIDCEKGAVMSRELLVFIADLLADGYLGERRIEFNFKVPFKIEEVQKDVRKLGFTPKLRIRGDGATQINLNSVDLCKSFLKLGIKDGKEKLIPGLVFKQDNDRIAEFLSRLISLDGYVNAQGQFEIMSSSKRFTQQVRALLFMVGVNAKYKTRKDRGFAKGKIQHMLRWNHFGWARMYRKHTVNPNHMRNLDRYLSVTSFNKECYDDVVPLNFEVLDGIRMKLGISKEKTHRDFWSINPQINGNTRLTKNLLKKVVGRFLELDLTDENALRLRKLSEGDYAFDEIVEVKTENYDGLVYNLTTESGNYFVDFVLTHNSGGLGTPAHLRVEAGAIHRSNKGVLFVDEVSSLGPRSQQELLTAMQERKYSITGQSELSSGAIVKTQPVPADFVLVAAGNLIDMQKMHPALRSRIRGYGYEIYMDDTMPDNGENRVKLVRFVAQEVKKDGKIPHFTREAVEEIVEEARRKSGRKRRLSLRFRELGGLVRAAGDVAIEEGAKRVDLGHVIKAKNVARTLEQQVSQQVIDLRKDYRVFMNRGYAVGKVNGLAVMGDGSSGIIMPIVAEVTPASSKSEGKLIATGKLGKIAKEAVENVSAIIKKHIGKDVSQYDMHVQFLQTYEGVEGDSASISIAVSVISAMEGVAVDQSTAMTGSLSVRGEVLPVGGITSKIEAAIDAGMKRVIIPEANREDVYLGKEKRGRIKIIPVNNIIDVLQQSLKSGSRKDKLLEKMEGMKK
ncbi:MAG: ATP-dependent protease LonB [Candidatus Micrarchaeota archaeon]|nr:ATP-dependent protease LonB [Candidatus Micrarchaeota archaeon]